MQLFEAAHTLSPAAQPQVPPAPEQVWPVTLQSAVVQHAPLGMQLFEAAHTFWPPGQAQIPPEQSWPLTPQLSAG